MVVQGKKQKDLHIAPMLDVSTPEFLNLFRILSKRAVLWTEMVVDETIIHTEHLDHHLAYSPELSPIVCQIGGRDAESCSYATKVAERYGYDEVNLNIDCPSSRVSGERKFGAILMKDCIAAYSTVEGMCSSVENVPVSVKCRVGIELEDGEILDTFEHLVGFIGKLMEKGCKKFFIHARKCVIGGLTPAQNRIVPPLNYPRVFDLCNHFPDCEFIINGGISGLAAGKLLCEGSGDPTVMPTSVVNEIMLRKEIDESMELTTDNTTKLVHSVPCDICNQTNGGCIAAPIRSPDNLNGCMIGRACMENPAMFADVDRFWYSEETNPCENRREVLEKYCLYLEQIYPRRCCDDDERKTGRLPAPEVKMYTTGGCSICKEFYGEGEQIGMNESLNTARFVQKEKIASGAIGRSLKPIRGLFFRLRKGKQFRLECDRLNKDATIRNCGPGYILRKVMHTMPDELLDQPFVKTEDLTEEEVPVHVAPVNCRGSCR